MKTKNSFLAKSVLAAISATIFVGCNSNNNDSDNNDSNGNDTSFDSVRVYYQEESTAYSDDDDNVSLYVWNDPDGCNAFTGNITDASDWNKGLMPSGIDNTYGVYWDLEVDSNEPSQCINFIPRVGGNKPLGEFDGKVDFTQLGKNNSVFTREGIAAVMPELISPLPDNTARIYMNTQDNDEMDFTLHIWNADKCQSYNAQDSAWPGISVSGVSEVYGAYWDIPTKDPLSCLNIIPNNKGSNGDYQTANLQFEFDKTGAIGPVGFIFKHTDKVYYKPLANQPSGVVELDGASAIFADANTLLIGNKDTTKLELYYSANGSLSYDADSKSISGYDKVITSQAQSSWEGKPHLTDTFTGFSFDFNDTPLSQLLKGQLLVLASDSSGVIAATKVQPATALDALYADMAADTELGAITTGGQTTFRLWAPTAQSVALIPYSTEGDAQKIAGTPIPMAFDTTTGAWEAIDTSLKHGDFYRYEITVYHPATGNVETYEVTDPYSLSLSMNSEHSQVVDLSQPDVTPANWGSVTSPHAQDNPAGFVLYESHIRDFSALDASTTEVNRGKYLAFTENSTPVEHLKSLEEAGVTHLHLMPTFDIATINEDPSQVANINQPFNKLCELKPAVADDVDFGSYCGGGQTIDEVFAAILPLDSAENAVVQRLNTYVRNVDAFNWGYDPFHYTVPEGSYASDADGLQRIYEFRQMVMAVKNDIGLNVVMDIVYNHTNEAGVSEKSVLDKIVPWYYQRLNEFSGNVENSTCCSNTAPENAMMAKLIKDSLVTWTKEYKIDAYRWDLMGHHPKAQIMESLAAVQSIDADTYFYGEGWDFGEVSGDRMFVQATQPNMYGTGVGTFSDRLRDAVRGGSPFDGGETIRKTQGFGNGAFVQPNEFNAVDKATALHLTDLVRLGMVGNLKDYQFEDSNGDVIKGSELDYNGAPAGYAKNADEIQNYVSKHDNQTLWDSNAYKIPHDVTSEERIRMQAVANATVLLGQGVVFSHMGGELLRSKSMQRDSYDSGDWFNFVDFTKQDNNWNVGLPREDKDGSNWGLIMNVILESGNNAEPTPADIAKMDSFYKELLEIRTSTPLFRLNDGETITNRVNYHNTGMTQIPGLIIQSITGKSDGNDLVIAINAGPDAQEFTGFDATGYRLHPIHTTKGSDSIAYGGRVDGTSLYIPAWSAMVFEKP